jgi:hypothetical protein
MTTNTKVRHRWRIVVVTIAVQLFLGAFYAWAIA